MLFASEGSFIKKLVIINNCGGDKKGQSTAEYREILTPEIQLQAAGKYLGASDGPGAHFHVMPPSVVSI